MTRNFLIFALSIRKYFNVAGIFLRHKSNVFHVGKKEQESGEGRGSVYRESNVPTTSSTPWKIRRLLLEDDGEKAQSRGNVNTREGSVGGEMTQLQLHTKAISSSAFSTRFGQREGTTPGGCCL